jgi:hypothetical protein
MDHVFPSQIVALIDQLEAETKPPHLGVNHLTAGRLTAIARLIDELPTELVTISGQDYSDLVAAVEAIRNAVAFWQHKGVGQIGMPAIRDKNILVLLREALGKCPDESPSAATAELAFITDHELRDSIRLDMSTATSALHNGEWKAATVLAGSAIEALLLWAIANASGFQALTPKPKGSLDSWDLKEYISVSRSLNLIKSSTEQLATLTRNFRNLIHPGRSQRLGEVCDRGTALAALAAVEAVVRDLK